MKKEDIAAIAQRPELPNFYKEFLLKLPLEKIKVLSKGMRPDSGDTQKCSLSKLGAARRDE
jgi:hypothetical protein